MTGIPRRDKIELWKRGTPALLSKVEGEIDMESYIQGREVEEVRVWTIRLCEERLQSMVVDDIATETQEEVLQEIVESLRRDLPLDQSEKHMLDILLDTELSKSIAKLGSLNVSDIDVLSMYSDAWGLYCI